MASIPAGANESWDAFLASLVRGAPQLAETVTARVVAEVEEFETIPRERLQADVLAQIREMLRAAGSGDTGTTSRGLAHLQQLSEQRAREGVAMDALFRSLRIGLDAGSAFSQDVANQHALPSDLRFRFLQSLLAWSDVAMAAAASAHRRVELETARRAQGRDADLIRALGEGRPLSAELTAHLQAVGLDDGRHYWSIRARPRPDIHLEELERALRGGRGHRADGLLALVDADLSGFVLNRPTESAGCSVGIGPPQPLDGLRGSYRLATRALTAAVSYDLRGIYDLDALGFRPAVCEDDDVGSALVRRYLTPLATAPSGGEIADTVRAYLRNGGHAKATAANLHIHENTLRYRLSRFEQLVGSSLRDPDTRLEVWWALERQRITRDATSASA